MTATASDRADTKTKMKTSVRAARFYFRGATSTRLMLQSASPPSIPHQVLLRDPSGPSRSWSFCFSCLCFCWNSLDQSDARPIKQTLIGQMPHRDHCDTCTCPATASSWILWISLSFTHRLVPLRLFLLKWNKHTDVTSGFSHRPEPSEGHQPSQPPTRSH